MPIKSTKNEQIKTNREKQVKTEQVVGLLKYLKCYCCQDINFVLCNYMFKYLAFPVKHCIFIVKIKP